MKSNLSTLILRSLTGTSLSVGSLLVCAALEGTTSLKAGAGIEFRWDQDPNYRRLYYHQTSNERRDRSTYYLVMKPKDRKTGLLKLKINVPKHFNSKIKPKKLTLCRINVGGMLEKTKCKEKIPAVFEVTRDKNKKTTIEVFPNQPIPDDKSGYALVMKVFNPTRAGMYQFDAIGQSPGDLPISSYIGSWTIDIR